MNPEAIIARIHAAFDAVPSPDPDDILADDSKAFIDPIEMRVALAGTHWSKVPISVLSYHREMIGNLGAIGFRAYIAAFLLATLAGDRRSAGIFEYTLFALFPLRETERERTRCRHQLLDPLQRAAIMEWLRYLADYEKTARRALHYWLEPDAA